MPLSSLPFPKTPAIEPNEYGNALVVPRDCQIPVDIEAAEVKAGEPLKVPAVEDSMLHISQAALGEVKKERGNESILLYATVDGKKIVLGTLSTEKCTQITYDLVFDKDFELSHSWKNGSVYFVGYQVEMPAEESDDDQFGSGDDSSEDDEVPPLVAAAAANGKPELKVEKLKASADKAKVVKPETSVAKPNAKIAKLVKDDKPKVSDDEDDDSDDSDEEDLEEDDSDDEVFTKN
ncbi:hypothetical protein IFM89_004688 [Coptis chinensis]|uniref:Nucleoplasmin-like domain-containing protein n=1 Tax=Coptis chinensis TaxID=261450 RepID=A0A835LHN3_9MAGN|nr:hypothetical protein IFM89_004688 [Coptis chinensis]